MASNRKKAHAPKQLKIAVGIAIAILFVLGIIQIAQGFIDTHNYSQQVIDAIQKQTGRKVTIKGSVTVSLLPTTTLFIPGVELRDPASDKPAPAVTVDMVSIEVPLMSVFSDHIDINSISLGRPILELVRADDNLIYWDWMNTSLMKALSANDTANGRPLTMTIVDGKILYRDNQTEKSTTIENINSTISSGKNMTAGGRFRIAGHDIGFTMDTKSSSDADSKDGTPFSLKVNSGAKDSLELEGSLNMSGDLPDLKGSFALKLENAPNWVQTITPQEKHLLQQVTNQFTSKKVDETMLPLSMTSNWVQHGLSVTMDDVKLDGLGSSGVGKVVLGWTQWKPNVAVDIKFTDFNYDQWSQLFTLALTKSDADAMVYHQVNEVADNPIPSNINLTLNLKADQIFYGQQTWKDAQMSTHIGSGAVTVNQFNVKLQGDSAITFFGVISPSTTGDLRFEGSMETKGKSLRQMLTIFDATAADLPETGFGEFFAHSNMFISSEQLRLSEADVKLGDLHLNGGLVAYFDANPRVEADIKLKNIDFDYFRNAWRDKQKNAEKQEDFFLKFDRGMNFSWLKKLQTAIDFKVYVQHFTFLDRNGDSAAFRLYAKNGELSVFDVNFIYPNDVTKGSFKLNVNGEQPSLSLNLTTGDLNTDYFNVEQYKLGATAVAAPGDAKDKEGVKKLEIEPQAETILLAENGDEVEPPKPASGVDELIKSRTSADPYYSGENKKQWSEKLLDMSWLGGFSGELELNVGRFVYKDVSLGNLKLKASFGNEQVLFKTLTFSYWGGQCSVVGSLYGGKVPGFSISFTVVDAQVQALLASLTNRHNISGQASISASITSSGVNMLSWVSQAEGKMVLIGRNIYVQGLNMQGVVDSVAISRTSSDVLNSVNRSIFNGYTIFSVDGNLNIKNGLIRTPGIGLRTTSTIGNMKGELRLVPWTLELSALFQFPSMPSETVPTLTVQYSGTPDMGELKTDTSSLESFVAKRIISQ